MPYVIFSFFLVLFFFFLKKKKVNSNFLFIPLNKTLPKKGMFMWWHQTMSDGKFHILEI